MRSRRAAAVFVGLALLCCPAAAGARAKVFRTPGYKGVRSAPRTLPQQPPTPARLGDGSNPQVLVDQAGTAHITWRVNGGGGRPDLVAYCRLKRGAAACDNPPATRGLFPDQPGGDPRADTETTTPRVLSSGDDLMILTHRYPNVVRTPDGAFSARNTYLFLSSDGGNSFPDPAEVGTEELSGQPAVFGEPGDTRIGLIGDTETGGAFFQSIAPGRFSRARASLGHDGIFSSAAPVGSSVMVAYTDISGQVSYLRTWSGRGDPNDAANWSLQTVPGAARKLAYGPAGVFLLLSDSDGRWFVRRVAPGTIGPPMIVDQADRGIGDLFEDPSGKLFATLRAFTDQGLLLFFRSSTDGGRTWGPRQSLFLATDGTATEGHLSATFDGGGVAVIQHFGGNAGRGGTDPIYAVRVGPQGPTGRPGLGGLAGGAADPGVIETCKKVEFAPVSIQAPEGCLLGVQGQPGTKVSEGTLRLNGLEIVPDPGVKIILNARTRTIDTTGIVEVRLSAPSMSPIVLARGVLHLKIPKATSASAAVSSGCAGSKAFDLDGSRAVVKGFPIGGSIDVYLSGESSCIPVSLGLPTAFGGVRGQAILRADNQHGLHLDSLRIDVDQAFIGPLLLQKLLITYDASKDEWFGSVDLQLPPQPGGIKFGADVLFRDGKFEQGNLRGSPPYPGIALDPFAVSYATQLRATFAIAPVTIGGGMTFGILPLPPDGYFFTVDANATVAFTDPVRLDFNGSGSLFGRFRVAELNGFINTNAQAMVSASTGLDVGVASVKGKFDAFVDGRAKVFNATLSGQVCVLWCGDGKAVLSTKGAAACAGVVSVLGDDIAVGFGYRWGEDLPEIFFSDCDLSDYQELAPQGFPSAKAAAASRTFRVVAGKRVAAVRLTGSDGPPNVVLVSPSGERITPATDSSQGGAKAYALSVPELKQTFVAIPRPAAGTWRVEIAPGSTEIDRLAAANPLPVPKVSVKVRGIGRTRTLSYSATTGNGLRTTFLERYASGERVIGKATRRRGRLRFAPGPGPGGPRAIVAFVERDGLPRLSRQVASYNAPAPPRLGRVRGVKVRRKGNSILVTWKSAAGAVAYTVRVDVSDGRRALRVVNARARSLRFPGVSTHDHVAVVVAARGPTGRAGSPSRARVR
jgi:hypothetical protein